MIIPLRLRRQNMAMENNQCFLPNQNIVLRSTSETLDGPFFVVRHFAHGC